MLDKDYLLQKIELLEDKNNLLQTKIQIMEKRQEAANILIEVYKNLVEELKASYDNGTL